MDANQLVEFEANGQKVKLNSQTVRNYLVSGDAAVTDQEIVMFLALCKFQKLNPFLREVYLIKYSPKYPATIVVSKEALLKRASRNPKYQGFQAGIEGEGENLSAWCEVYVDGYEKPIRSEVYYEEYVGLVDVWENGKKTGEKVPNSMWAGKKKTMLRKVAVAQGHREAFPEDCGNMITAAEVREISEILPTDEIEPKKAIEENADLELKEHDPDFDVGPSEEKTEIPKTEDPLKLSPKEAFEKVRIRLDTKKANNIILEYSKKVGRALGSWEDQDFLTIGKRFKDIA